MELKNETSKFRSLFLFREPRIQAAFSMLPSFVEMRHPKRIEKSECENENGSNPNPEFSFFTFMGGYLFCQRFPHLGWAIRDELPTVFCCAVRRVFAGKKKLLI